MRRGRREERTGLVARLIDLSQEIYQGMARMEERVEALETILIHTEKKDAS